MAAAPRLLPRLLAGLGMLLTAVAPLPAHAASLPTIDSLWNTTDAISIDSPLYPLQTWWNSWNRPVADDPVQRGISELSQANSDLLNAYQLLQEAHGNGGAQPVPVIDPLLSSAYDAITGSNARAPLGSLGNWINDSLLSLEGRGSKDDLAGALLQDYRDKQAVAVRDLKPHAELTPLLASNAERAADFLSRLQAEATPEDGVTTLLTDATRDTMALANPGAETASTHGGGGGAGKSQAPGQQPGHGKAANPGQGQAHGKGKTPSTSNDAGGRR